MNNPDQNPETQMQPQAPARPRQAPPLPPQEDTLDFTSFGHLPDYYRADSGEDVAEPCWKLLADGYYGDTLWLSGEIITARMTPNHHLEPLNRAAGIMMSDWLNSLPVGSAGLRDEDLIEASYMLRPREGVPEMTHEQFSSAMIKLARNLKDKREGREQRQLPELYGVRSAARPGAAPMPNATFTDPALARFGQQQEPVLHQPQQPRNRVRKVVPAAGNLPPTGAQQGA